MMKKLVFGLIALLCFLLIGCKEKQVNEKPRDMYIDSKVNLENKQDLERTNKEQVENIDEKTQVNKDKLTIEEVKLLNALYESDEQDGDFLLYNTSFEDRVRNIEEKKESVYLINYNSNESKYICGYIDVKINELLKAEPFLIFPDETNYLRKIKMKLDNMGIEFNFNDILWEVYKDVNDIKTQYDLNYILAFVFKENIISVVDDLLDECVGKRFIDFVGMPKNIKEKNIKDYEVESGDYLVFSKKISEDKMNIGNILQKSFMQKSISQFFVKKINSDNQFYILKEVYENGNYFDFMANRFGNYLTSINSCIVGTFTSNDNNIYAIIDLNSFLQELRAIIKQSDGGNTFED